MTDEKDPLATAGVVLSTRQIEALIPHRWPFLLVDRIVEYDPSPSRRASAIGSVSSRASRTVASSASSSRVTGSAWR